jgi:DNA-binding Lrp family transcriptional regulator
MEAMVFLNVDVGLEDKVMEEVTAIPEVRAAYFTYGPYDIAVRVEVPSLEALKQVVSGRIRKIKGVRSTVTMIVMRSYRRQ